MTEEIKKSINIIREQFLGKRIILNMYEDAPDGVSVEVSFSDKEFHSLVYYILEDGTIIDDLETKQTVIV